jgi:hypothetical protein
VPGAERAQDGCVCATSDQRAIRKRAVDRGDVNMRGVGAWICLACLANVLPNFSRLARGEDKVEKITYLTPRGTTNEQADMMVGLIGNLDKAVALADTVSAQMPRDQSGVHQGGVRKAWEIVLPGNEIASMCADPSLGHASVRLESRTRMDFVFRKRVLSEVTVRSPQGAFATFEAPTTTGPKRKSEGSLTGGVHLLPTAKPLKAGEFLGTTTFNLGEGALSEGRRGRSKTDGPTHVDKSIPEQVWSGCEELKAGVIRTFVRAARQRVSDRSSTHRVAQSRSGKGG